MRLMLKGVTVNRKMEERMLFHSLIKDMHNVSKLIIQQGLVDLSTRKHPRPRGSRGWESRHVRLLMCPSREFELGDSARCRCYPGATQPELNKRGGALAQPCPGRLSVGAS